MLNTCRYQKIIFALTICSWAWCAHSNLHADDWYCWRGPDANGISKESGWSSTWPAEGPKKLWTANVGIGFSAVSVAKGHAYTMGNKDAKDTVYCFDAVTGQELWKCSYPSPLGNNAYEGGTHTTPAVDGDRVYTLGKYGDLYCLETDTGKVVWSKNLAKELGVKLATWWLSGSVLVQGDRLFVNVGQYGTALDKSGKVLWTTGKEPSGYSSFVPCTIQNQKSMVVMASNAVVALDTDTGKVLWSYPWKTQYDSNASDPIISDDTVFISSGYGHGAALLKIADNKPTVVWENKVLRDAQNNSVLINGYIYGFDNKDLKCIELKTGEAKWTEKGLGRGSLMAADGKLIIISEKGELVVAPADPSAFKAAARAQVLNAKTWTQPVLANGRIYCRDIPGNVVCVDVSGK